MKSLTFIAACSLVLVLELFGPLKSLKASETQASQGQPNLTQSAKENWVTLRKGLKTKSGRFHYEIHYDENDAAYAKRVVEILEKKAARIFEYFDYVPEWTVHFNIIEASTANGSATVFPSNYINLYNFPPAGHDHLQSIGDWVEGLVLHELVHVVHMEQTRGFLAGMENIFGSVGRLGGVVPRWFTEGIAVWAESHLAGKGRLSSRQIRMELEARLLDPHFCREIDCLDNPGSYPYGQLSYWMGAYFLQHLEEKKPGTIRCLIVENSDNIPFMLNNAFVRCLGARAWDLFREFRAEYVNEIKSRRETFQNSTGQKDLKRFSLPKRGEHGRDEGSGVPLWRAGRFVQDGKFYFALSQDAVHILAELNLETGEIERTELKEGLVRFSKPSEYSHKQREFLASFSGFDILGIQRTWFVYSSQTHGRLRKLPFLNNALEAFQKEKDVYVGLFFEGAQWVLKKFKVRGEKVESELLKVWPEMAKVSEVSLKNNSLYYKLHWPWAQNEHHEYQFHRFPLGAKKEGQRFFTSEDPFRYYGKCNGKHLFHSNEKDLTLIRPRESSEINFEGITHTIDWSDQIADFLFGPDDMVALTNADPTALYRVNLDCEQVVKEMTLEVVKKTVAPGEVTINNDKDEQKKRELQGNTEDYPSWDHFLPHYWFFGFGRSTNLSFLSVSTQLMDPLRSHIYDLSLNRYSPSESGTEWGGDFRYTYNWQENQFSMGYNKRFFQSSFIDEQVDREESVFTSYRHIWDLGRYWAMAPELSFSKERQLDFLSSRQTMKGTAGLSLMNFPTYAHAFFQGGELSAKLMRLDAEDREEFWGYSFKAYQEMRLTRQMGLTFRGTYARLKNEFLPSGTLYGGGYNSIGGVVEYPLYGMEYSDLYGRELTTGRLQTQYTLFRPYTAGGGFTPVYLKKIQMLLGVEGAHSEFGFFESAGKTFVNEWFRSEHAGIRMKTVLAYSFPVNVDVIYSQVHNPDGGGAQKRWIVTLNAGVLP